MAPRLPSLSLSSSPSSSPSRDGILLAAAAAAAATAAVAACCYAAGYRPRRRSLFLEERGGDDNSKRAILITGCDTGFGQLLTLEVIRRGYAVVAACYSAEGAEQYASYDNATTVVADLTTSEGRERVVAATQDRIANDPGLHPYGLYALVNNAGIAYPGYVDYTPMEYYYKTMELNFHAPTQLIYALLPLLLKHSKDLEPDHPHRIINVTSVDGFCPLPTNAAYCASKHALEAYSDSLRAELYPHRDRLRVVVVQPSTMKTALVTRYADLFRNVFRAADPSRQEWYDPPYDGTATTTSSSSSSSSSSSGNDENKTTNNSNNNMIDPPPPPSWIDQVHAKSVEALKDWGSDPLECADDMLRALQSPDPPARVMTGFASKYVWKPISHLPDERRDAALHAMICRPHPPTITQAVPKPPPMNIITHVTVKCTSLRESMAWYGKLGFTPVGRPYADGIFLKSGSRADSKGKWSTLILLQQDPEMTKRADGTAHHCNDSGMTRVCLLTTDMGATLARLASRGVSPRRDAVSVPGTLRLAAFADPDGLVVYYIQFDVPVAAQYIRFRVWRDRVREPILFSVTLNVRDSDRVNRMLRKELGFIPINEQTSDQVALQALPAFGLSATDSFIKQTMYSHLPRDSMQIVSMEWVEPRSKLTGQENDLYVSISVPSVVEALKKAHQAGMYVPGGDRPEEVVRKKTLPYFGDVYYGVAYVEKDSSSQKGYGMIEYISF